MNIRSAKYRKFPRKCRLISAVGRGQQHNSITRNSFSSYCLAPLPAHHFKDTNSYSHLNRATRLQKNPRQDYCKVRTILTLVTMLATFLFTSSAARQRALHTTESPGCQSCCCRCLVVFSAISRDNVKKCSMRAYDMKTNES